MSEMGQPCQSGSSLVSRTATSGPAVTRDTLYQQHTHTHTHILLLSLLFYLLLSNRVGEFCTASIFAPLLPHSLKVSPEANHGLPHQTSPALFPRYLGSLSHVILSQQITRPRFYFSVILDTLSTENHDYALSYTIPKKAHLIGANLSNKKARPCLLRYLHISIRSKSIPARRKNSPSLYSTNQSVSHAINTIRYAQLGARPSSWGVFATVGRVLKSLRIHTLPLELITDCA